MPNSAPGVAGGAHEPAQAPAAAAAPAVASSSRPATQPVVALDFPELEPFDPRAAGASAGSASHRGREASATPPSFSMPTSRSERAADEPAARFPAVESNEALQRVASSSQATEEEAACCSSSGSSIGEPLPLPRLRLQVVAGPAHGKSFTLEPGARQVRAAPHIAAQWQLFFSISTSAL